MPTAKIQGFPGFARNGVASPFLQGSLIPYNVPVYPRRSLSLQAPSDSSLYAGWSSRLTVLWSPHQEWINNREEILDRSDALTQEKR